MRHVPVSALALALTVGLGSAAFAATDFQVKPGGMQFVGFESDAPIETINGISTQAAGTLAVDLAAPAKSRGTITVPVTSITTGNATRDGHLHGEQWLDSGKHPNITFAIEGLKFDSAKALADKVKLSGTVTGKLTIKGVTKTLSAPVRVTYVAASEALKKAYINGNALRVRTKFDVKLADFGIKAPSNLGPKVAETVEIDVKLTGVDQ
jgi:polyisoprenoid-binding protein YceI